VVMALGTWVFEEKLEFVDDNSISGKCLRYSWLKLSHDTLPAKVGEFEVNEQREAEVSDGEVA
jgi:hypothetical protein